MKLKFTFSKITGNGSRFTARLFDSTKDDLGHIRGKSHTHISTVLFGNLLKRTTRMPFEEHNTVWPFVFDGQLQVDGQSSEIATIVMANTKTKQVEL